MFKNNKDGQLKEAAESVATLLLHSPNNPDHLFNKAYYTKQNSLTQDDFVPRKVSVDMRFA